MRLYLLTDYGDISQYYVNRMAAVKAARKLWEEDEKGDASSAITYLEVKEVEIDGPINRQLICRLLEGEHCTITLKTVWERGGYNILSEREDE